MAADANIKVGFGDYGGIANGVFRTCLDALSRPGLIRDLAGMPAAPAPLLASGAAVLLTLADFETTFWLDDELMQSTGVEEYIRFHTGARRVTSAAEADFVVFSDTSKMARLSAFKSGTREFPDRSATLIVQVDQLLNAGLVFTGPGIDGQVSFSTHPEIEDFASQLIENRAAFPCGVDLIFVTETQMAALPRSVNVSGA